MKNLFLVAVYGSLKRGFYNSYLLEDSKFLGSFQSEKNLQMHSFGGFPALVKKEKGGASIYFEVYSVDEDTLDVLYQLEGYTGVRNHPRNWYNTEDIETPWGSAEFFYHEGEIKEPIVKSGNWGK